MKPWWKSLKKIYLKSLALHQRSNNESEEADADSLCDPDDEKDSLVFNEEI